jgi:hypothetical protein
VGIMEIRGVYMINSIRETRTMKGDLYNIMLEINEKEYFDIYKNIDDESAEEILKQYMVYHGEDGRYSHIRIQHDKNTHIVNVYANIHYLENRHTDQFNIPHIDNKL